MLGYTTLTQALGGHCFSEKTVSEGLSSSMPSYGTGLLCVIPSLVVARSMLIRKYFVQLLDVLNRMIRKSKKVMIFAPTAPLRSPSTFLCPDFRECEDTECGLIVYQEKSRVQKTNQIL